MDPVYVYVFVTVVPFAALELTTALASSAGDTDCQIPNASVKTKSLRINIGARSRISFM